MTTRRLDVVRQILHRRDGARSGDLLAELELAQAEIARLRSEQHRAADVDGSRSGIARILGCLAELDDDGDDAWGRLAETERIRLSLLELCRELEKALHAITVELSGSLPLVEADRRRRTDLEFAGLQADDGSPAA